MGRELITLVSSGKSNYPNKAICRSICGNCLFHLSNKPLALGNFGLWLIIIILFDWVHIFKMHKGKFFIASECVQLINICVVINKQVYHDRINFLRERWRNNTLL